MSTPVDMQPLFWLLVLTPLAWCLVMAVVGMLLVPASHTDPGDDPWAEDLTDVFDQDEPCPACGDPVDLAGECGCGLNPKRRLERTRETWA